MNYFLRTFKDPVLKAVCSPVEPGEDVSDLIAALRRLMKEHCGVGMAAPQVGAMKRVIVVQGTPMVNPVVISRSEATSEDTEGCLSYPGVYAKVRRAMTISVKFTDWRGVAREQDFAHYEARIVQHEIDHLNGVCLVGAGWQAQEALKKQGVDPRTVNIAVVAGVECA